MTLPLPEKHQWDKSRLLPDRNSNLTPAHRHIFLFPDLENHSKNLEDECWLEALLLPESNLEIVQESAHSFGYAFFSYPIPTHSIHNRIAFEKTVCASLRQMPKTSIAIPMSRRNTCTAAFFNTICFPPVI